MRVVLLASGCLVPSVASASPERAGGERRALPAAPASHVNLVATWRGVGRNRIWTDPSNWDRGVVPGPFDAARFDERSTDVVLDEEASGALGTVILEKGFTGTIRLGRDLSVTGSLVIAGGSFVQGPHCLSAAQIEQTGGRLSGGTRSLEVSGAMAVRGGILETPRDVTRIRTLEIRPPGVVRVGENGRLELTGDGAPFLGDGLLDTTTNRPTSVEFTGRATMDLPFAPDTASQRPPGNRLHEGYRTRTGGWETRLQGRTPLAFGDAASTLGLYAGESNLFSAVADTTSGFAYFSADNFGTDAAAIVKVRTSDLTRVGALTLNAGESGVSTAVIDPVAGFAYFGTRTSPGMVVKVRLSDFSRVGTLTLGAGENNLTCALIDTNAGFAYFGGSTQPGFVAKVRLSDFALVDVLTLEPDELPRVAVIDPSAGFAYFAAGFGNVVKIRLSDFTRVAVLRVNPAPGTIVSAVIDPVAGFAYFAASIFPLPVVIRVRLADFSRVDELSLTSVVSPGAAVIDPGAGFAYFASFGSPGIIDKVRLSDFTRVATIPLNAGEASVDSAVIDPAAGCALFGTNTTPGLIVKVRLSDFARVGALKLEMREDTPWAAAFDPGAGFAYFGTYTSPGVVVKVRLSDFTRIGALTLADGENLLASTAIDPAAGFALFGTDTVPGRVVKVRLSDFTRVAALTLDAGESGLDAAVIDPFRGFAYFATAPPGKGLGAPSAVVKVRTSDLTRVGALTMSNGPSIALSAAIDSGSDNAYFGIFEYLGLSSVSSVVKVSITDFTIAGKLTLDLTDQYLDAAAIDSAAGFLYLGTCTYPGKVIKVRLADLTRFADLTLGAGESCLVSALIDPTTSSLYVGTYSDPGQVVKIRLANFARAGALNVSEPYLTAAIIDSAAGFAYFGTHNFPAKILRVDLSTIPEPTATVDGSAAICAGTSAVVRAYLTGIAPWSITWSDGFIQTGLTTSPAERSVSPTATTTYSVSAILDSNGVSGSSTGQAVMTVNSPPLQPRVSAPEWAFAGATGLTASVTGHPGSSYAWSVENGVLTSNYAQDHITFTLGTSGTTLLTVVESAANCPSPQATASVLVVDPGTALTFHTLTPCRVFDTRDASGPAAAGPSLGANESRYFPTTGRCSIPPTARALSINTTVTSPTSPGYLTLFAASAFPTVTNNLSFGVSQTRANNGIVQIGTDVGASIGVQNNSTGTVHFILDVNGYFE